MKPSATLLALGPIVALLLLHVPAKAERFLLEPERGIRSLSDDAGDLLGVGVTVGGTFGYFVAPKVALTAHADIGLHDAASEHGADEIVSDGETIYFSVGARFYPLSNSDSPLSLFLGGSVGRETVAWQYTSAAQYYLGAPDDDAVGSWAVGAEGGLLLRLSESFWLGAGVRVNALSHDDMSDEDYDASDFTGNSATVFGVLSIRL